MTETKTKTYNVLSALRHDGQKYGPEIEEHDTVDLTDAQAVKLLELKVVALPDEPVKPEPTAEERFQAITTALIALDPDKDFTKAGTPKVKKIEAIVGFEVSAAELGALWEAHQGESD